jgi:hypothetical protein
MKALDFVATVSDYLGWGEVTTIENPDDSVRKILRTTNLVLRSLQTDTNWKELRRSGVLVTQEPLELADIAISAVLGESSIFVALTGAGYNPNDYINCLLRVGSGGNLYRITAYEGVDRLTLDRPWTDPTVGANGQVTIMRDTYHLPEDYDRMVSRSFRNQVDGTKVDLVGEDEIEYQRTVIPQGSLAGQPERVAIYGRSPSGLTTVVFDRAPNKAYLFDYEYQCNHPHIKYDTQDILYPERHGMHIIDQVVARLNRDVENAQNAMQTAQEALAERVRQGANPDSGNARLRFSPRTGRRY